MASRFSVKFNMSDEIIDIKCCFCAEDNRVREAEKYCVQCSDYFCASCVETHRKFPGTKEHKLLDKSDLGSLGPDGSLPSFPTQRCAQHPAKVVDMFCQDHNEVACASCMFLSHRACKNVQSIPDNIDSLYNSAEVSTAKQKITKTKTNMQEIKKDKEQKLWDLKEDYDKQVESVRMCRQELQTLLDSMEEQTIQELKKKYDRIEASLTGEINDVNRVIKAADDVSSQLRKSEGNKAEQFIGLKSFEKVMANANDVEIKHQERTDETVTFKADQNIRSMLQQYQVLGQVSCRNPNSLYRVKCRREIDVKLVNDTYKDERHGECYIWGSCMTADGSILLTDQSNDKLKHLDIQTGTIKDYIEFEEGPVDVCLINKTEGVVTLDNYTVQFVSLGRKMTPTRRLTMNHECMGIAHKDGKLFITDQAQNVYIHDINGKQLRKISTDATGKQIFQKTRHITINAAGDRVFVANDVKGVVVLDTEGNYLSTLTDSTMLYPIAVCTDGRNLFVGGGGSNIVQIGQNNKLIGEILKIEKPLSLCYDPYNNRLIVSCYKSNKVTVLDLEQ